MPTKKPKREPARGKPPPLPQQPDPKRSGQESANGLTGRGADSALVHLIEQEKNRGRKPERG